MLEPGDMLYVPPGLAHNGIALGDDCMTYSIGFRAPSRAELLEGWTEHVLDALDDDDRYADPDLTAQTHPGEIAPDAIARLQGMVADRLLDRDAFARWFGRFATAPKNADIDWQPESRATAATLRRALARGTAVLRNPASRFAFVAGDADAVTLFVDGEAYRCEGALAACARELCADARVTFNPGVGDSDAAVELFAELLDRGCIAFDPEG